MKKALLILTLTSLTSCGSMKLERMDTAELKTVKVKKTGLTKKAGFNSTSTFLSKYINNSNHAIRLRDEKSGKIVAKIGYACKGLKRPDIVTTLSETVVDYTVDVAFKKGKARVSVEMTGFTKNLGTYGIHDMFIAKDEGQKEAVQSCNKSLISEIFKGMMSESKTDNW